MVLFNAHIQSHKQAIVSNSVPPFRGGYSMIQEEKLNKLWRQTQKMHNIKGNYVTDHV